MILGIDIGGTTTKIGIVKDKKITKRYVIDTHPKTLIDDIIKSLKDNNVDLKDIISIGCAVPGFINHTEGIITLSGNLGFKDYKFKKEFEKKINKPVAVVNDANAAALGEFWAGAGSKYSSLVLYTLGTGVGGGIVIGGQLVFGQNDYAGELGHGGNFQNERPCSCGLKNCIEPMSSAKGIEQSLLEVTGKKMSVKDSVKDFIAKDPKVVEAYRKSLTPLANHIATMETAINPSVIIIGGGPSNIGKPLTDFISELVKEVQIGFIHDSTLIMVAETGNDAGILGAAYWSTK